MKHILNKSFLQGGGKKKPKQKPQPAILRPPEIGNFEVLNSYSVAEVIDMISDGPIEGLVNQNGQKLGASNSILQGVYLDNTPIEITSAKNSAANNQNIIAKYDYLSPILNLLGDTYFDNNTQKYKTYQHKFKYNEYTPTATLQEDRVLYSVIRYYGRSYTDDYYSPLNGGSIGHTGNGWTWHSRYHFSASNIELHIGGSTLFASNTILSTLESEISLEKAKSTHREKIALDAEKALIKFKSESPSSDEVYVVVKIGSESDLIKPFSYNPSLATAYNNNSDTLADVFFRIGVIQEQFAQNEIVDIALPIISDDKQYNGEIFGCLIFKIKINSKSSYKKTKVSSGRGSYNLNTYHDRFVISNVIPFTYESNKTTIYFSKGLAEDYVSKTARYNFTNISCEFKDGSEFQDPLKYFSKIYNDFEYNSELYGPFKKGYSIQRITGGLDSPEAALSLSAKQVFEQNLDGSDDIRNANGDINYSDWNAANSPDEDASSITHTIENPNTSSVYFTLGVSALSDTVEIDKAKGSLLINKTIQAGSKIPSIVNIKVEWGKISNTPDKVITESQIKYFSILALVEGQMLIDFGSPDMQNLPSNLESSIKNYNNESLNGIKENILFNLEPLTIGEQSSSTKRFIKITKLSTESNSVLIRKDIFLSKVTEVIDNKLSYPFSAIAGIKLDARSFSSVPERSYDCKLKKIKIPVNYEITDIYGSDKRYIAKSSEYTDPQQIYVGDWNGEFKIGWTDNPAWIIYDLLTSKRYGLGSYIDESQINKWELYKISRFCDAVDENGFFQGVSDGSGGLEPRYSCNLIFREKTKIFDAINIVASLFRGIVFFSNSEIHFLDDRPREPICIFTNSNVKDGIFNYGNNRRDQQFNTVEVAYLDRMDNYQSKIEYVQDESDIRKRGVFKTTINTMGVTSRAMARRVGQHIIYQTIKENQTVEFMAGLESLLCRPGDLVIIEDDLKTRSSNYGRILSIDNQKKSFIIDNQFLEDNYNNSITIFTPTGFISNEEFNEISQLNRSRVQEFDITSDLVNESGVLTGKYYFSGYVDNSPEYIEIGGQDQYPVYTGISNSGHNFYCYYNNQYTGFVFSTGKAFENNSIYNKIITNTGVLNLLDIQSSSQQNEELKNYLAFEYENTGDGRTANSGNISGKLDFYQSSSYYGVTESEISQSTSKQITKFSITGYENLDYGSEIYIDQNDPSANLLSVTPDASAYRIERKNASEQIYKVISIREQNQNEYSITASKYDTGKFVEIENFSQQDVLADTYYSGPTVVNNINIKQLDPPTLTNFEAIDLAADGFSLTGAWDISESVTGFKVEVYNLITNSYLSATTPDQYIGFTGISSLGDWRLRVTNLGNGSSSLNSLPSETGVFVAYSTITEISKPAITTFTIL